MQVKDNTPILIGSGQQTWRETDYGRTPVDALEEASQASHPTRLWEDASCLARIRLPLKHCKLG